jgi:hypothetical protein
VNSEILWRVGNRARKVDIYRVKLVLVFTFYLVSFPSQFKNQIMNRDVYWKIRNTVRLRTLYNRIVFVSRSQNDLFYRG